MRSMVRAAVAALSLALTAAAVAPSAAQAQQLKVGYVDVSTVMEAVPGRAEAQAAFEKEAGGIQAELRRMQDSLQTLFAAYQKEQPTLAPAARTARERAIQERQQSYAQRAQALQERGQQREQELANQFEGLVRDAINDVRTTESFTMIFALGPNSALLSADKSLDVTDRVLARMRTIAASRPATSRPAAQTGAPVAAPAGVSRPRPSGN